MKFLVKTKDFTLSTYTNLLIALKTKGFSFYTFSGYLQREEATEPKHLVILRHDVDQYPENSLRFAQLEAELGVHGTYYFRAEKKTRDANIITKIAAIDHEIGYHYEDLSLVNGNIDKAYSSFCRNLEKLRKLYPVKTICMHGSPRSKWDSKDIWKKYSYRELGIIGEPYFDINFDEVFYLTDTGRRWDGWKVSLRDKIPQQEQWEKQGLVFHSTNDIIQAAKNNQLPNIIMITTHPQRWSDKLLPWIKEYVAQNMKNMVKRVLVISKKLGSK